MDLALETPSGVAYVVIVLVSFVKCACIHSVICIGLYIVKPFGLVGGMFMRQQTRTSSRENYHFPKEISGRVVITIATHPEMPFGKLYTRVYASNESFCKTTSQ